MIRIACTQHDRDKLATVEVLAAVIADDGSPFNGERVVKPWGHEQELHRDKASSLWLLQLKPGKETSLHCHPNKTTFLFVMHGLVRVSSLSRDYDIEAGECVVIEPGAFHRTATREGAALYEIECPPNKRDLVRLHDAYGRGQGYETSDHAS